MNRIAVTLGVLALVAIAGFAGTQAFYNDTETSEDNIFTAGSVDLRVDHTRQTYNGKECTSGECLTDMGTNLITNGGFEDNPVTEEEGWEIFEDGVVAAWSVEWADASANTHDGESRPSPALVEHHGGVNGWSSSEGEQYAELDSDWDGPDGSLDGEPALVRISQDVSTTSGETYELRFMFAARPDTGTNQNELEVYVDGSEIAPSSYIADGTGDSDPQWTEYTYQFDATSANTEIAFEGAGENDSLGVLLDDVRVHPVECGTQEAIWQCELWEEKDLEDEQFFVFNDIKPGDWGTNQISLHSDDNDAYACLVAHDGENDENGVVDPELDAGDDTADGVGEGELQNYLNFFAWIDGNQNGEYDGDGPDDTPLGQSSFANLNETLAALDSNNGEYLEGSTVEYIGLEWCAGDISVNHTTGDVDCDGNGMLNDAQTDSFSSSLTAYAEQTRNNDGFTCDGVLGGSTGGDGSIGCSDEADIMLVLDSSGSIGNDMSSLQDDAKSFVTTLAPSASGVNVGVVDFDADGTVEEGLTDDVSALESAIDGMVAGGSTNMTAGINAAQTELADNGRPGAPNFMIVLTDGEPDDETDAGNAASSAISDGTTIYAIGVGSGANETFLRDNIVSTPEDDHYFSAADFDSLEDEFNNILTCDPDQT